MSNYAYAVTTFNGPKLVETLHGIPKGSRLVVLDTSDGQPLCWAWNRAIDRLIFKEKYDYVIIMNDDVVIRPTTGDELVHAISTGQFSEKRPREECMLLLVSCFNVRDIERSTLDSTCNWAPLSEEGPWGPDDIHKFSPRWGLGPDYSAFCVGKGLFDQVGKFDEEFPLYFEDNDSHYRIQKCGFEALSYAPYYHYGSSSLNATPTSQDIGAEKYRRSEQRYAAKWGGSPGKETYTTPFGVHG